MATERLSIAIGKCFIKSAAAFRKKPAAATVMLLGAAYGIFTSFAYNRGAWDSPVALALLTVLVGINSIIYAAKQPSASNKAKFVAFILLLPAAWIMLRGMVTDDFWTRNTVLTLITAAVIMHNIGPHGIIAFLPFMLLSFWVIPFQEVITLSVSYPLRLSSTAISVSILYIAGMDISFHLTSIFVGDTNIAITDACSGVEQLGVLLLLGFIVVHRLNTGIRWKIVYFMTLLPIVMAANAIRLIITVLLYKMIGNDAFALSIHISLGYVFVVLSVVMLYYAGKLFPENENEG